MRAMNRREEDDEKRAGEILDEPDELDGYLVLLG